MITDDQSLVAARTRWGSSLPVYDDGFGRLYVYMNEYGAVRVIRAQSFEDAYGIAIDEMTTIPQGEVPEAYGQWDAFAEWICERTGTAREGGSPGWKHVVDFVGEYLPVWFRIKVEEWSESGDWPGLDEDYQHQSNSTGTGIVCTGHYERLEELTPELMERLEIDLVIEEQV